MFAPWKKSYDKPRQRIKKQRDTLPLKVQISQWTEDCRLGWGPLPTTREVDSTSRHRGWEASRMEATDDAHSKLLINIFTSTGAAPDGKLGLEIPAPCRSHDSPTTEVRQEPGDSPFLPLGRVCINEIVKVFWKPRNCMRFSALSHSVVSDSLWVTLELDLKE